MDRRRLGPAVLAAAREAGAAHLAAWAEQAAAEPAPADPPAFTAPTAFAPSTAMIDHVLYLIRRVEQEQRAGTADDAMATRGRCPGAAPAAT